MQSVTKTVNNDNYLNTDPLYEVNKRKQMEENSPVNPLNCVNKSI